jgi:hypothetical protein
MPTEKTLTPWESLRAALDDDARVAAAELVERVLRQSGVERARAVVAELVDKAFREEVAELREREQISKRVGSVLR